MNTEDLTAPFTLYYASYSAPSIMVRLTFAMGGDPSPGRPDMIWQKNLISLSPDNPEQLTEFFLCKINPDGQVPVLANDALFKNPMPEAIDITWYICEWYPLLLPLEHERTIRELITKLHNINFAVLTFGPQAQNPERLRKRVEQLLQHKSTSDEYRRALQHKSQLLLKKQDGLNTENLAEAECQTRAICAEIADLKSQSQSDGFYIFGSRPTALDAHVLVFLRRLHDAGHDALVPPSLREWAEEFSQMGTWSEVALGGLTLPPSPFADPK